VRKLNVLIVLFGNDEPRYLMVAKGEVTINEVGMFSGGEVHVENGHFGDMGKKIFIAGGGYVGGGRYSFTLLDTRKIVVDLQTKTMSTSLAPTGLLGKWWIGDKEPEENKNVALASFTEK
jgi:hypothetical protein